MNDIELVILKNQLAILITQKNRTDILAGDFPILSHRIQETQRLIKAIEHSDADQRYQQWRRKFWEWFKHSHDLTPRIIDIVAKELSERLIDVEPNNLSD